MQTEDLIALNEEIAGMARAGLPLDQGLAALAREMGRGRLRAVTAALADDLREGRTLPEALARQEGRVPPFYAGLVAAGVRTGRVGDVLTTLTVYARTIADVKATVAGALFYPAIVLAFSVLLIGAYCYYILPQFEQIFRDFNMRLPAATEMVLWIGRDPVKTFVLPVSVLLAGPLILWFGLGGTESGRRTRARLFYTIPVLGTLIRAARLAAFADLLGILVDHETPLPEAFGLAGEASSDPVIAGASRHICEQLGKGVPLAEALRGRGLVPEWVSWMVGLGEQRGNLGQALHQIADMYRRQVETRAAVLRSVLPPFLIVVTAGVFITLFIFSIIFPMFKLLEGLSK
jgi:type II secretory pathway component PulF